MVLARRLAVAVAALLGLALAVFGAWFAFVLGPKGTAAFHASSNAPLVLGPNVLNRVNAPVTVTAESASGPVFVGAAVPQDVDELVGKSKHNFVAYASFPARTLTVEQLGTGDLQDPSESHVWRSTGEASITVSQEQAPQAVLVYPTKGGSFDVAVTVARNTWFLQSLVALVVGLIVVAFAGGWLWQSWRAAREGGEPTEAPVTPSAEAGDGATAESLDATPEPAPTEKPAENATEPTERAEETR